MRRHLVAGFGLALATVAGAPVGCSAGAARSAQAGATVAADTAVLSTLGAHWFLQKECRGDACRGWAVRRLDGKEPVRRVDDLDFSNVPYDPATLRIIEDAEPGEVIVRGSFDVQTDGSPTGRFLVDEAFRGMPGIRPAPGDAFYAIEPPTAAACHTAACGNGVAVQVDTRVSFPVGRVDVSGAAAPHVDHAWLANRVMRRGALFAAHLEASAQADGGAGPVLSASQVYVRLPEHGGPCLLQHHLCEGRLVPAYTRDANLCLVFRACVDPDACLPPPPIRCLDGYDLVTWRADDATCAGAACDPAFVRE